MPQAASSFHLNGLTIHPGEQVLTRLVISKLPSGTVIDVPVHVMRATEPGPTLLLMAGMHGDEVNGIETIRRLVRRELLQPLRGSIIAIPILNIYGFLNFSRDVPDGKDVNRSFPGFPRGSLAGRVAHRFMREIMPLIDYGIDFHTGGAARANFPQVRCLLGVDDEVDAMAEAFAAPFTLHAALRPGSLRESAHRLGKRIIVYETGESLRLDETGIEEALAGTLRVLHHLGMAPAAPPPSRPGIVCRRHTWLRARFAGLFRAHVENGQYLEKGQVYGSVADPYGQQAVRLESPVSGYVIGLNYMPVVNQGDALLHIAVPE
ncbi:succinylglutamate desuccinylase/aspartoacylase family protein [Hymenobacter sp. BT770]|uniref:succinylglutamate desuccinylase/aspartoacylase family protein n=1 Tax=Hymenobacter sp. BT770 TaxID=2886942 RepID=UPI001D0FFA0B|nr:succinylglutamate desuccinylase/aspartoacylase family protein [Hymenobacter sp. BT770]MCC3151664.1 succinylglutamate desuccinylase/aspartoacylase family protein [Hymenobacter sp. BT770]MDO3413758.1 succinylglutamate desuccinylase/aspartoacylase family protein [Hymenobacter sp. BT770]